MAPVIDLLLAVTGTAVILAVLWLIVAAVMWLIGTYHRPVTTDRVRPPRAEPVDFHEALKSIGGPPSWESVKRSEQ
jgi:Na+-transporting methylmalonyl-CoA/oxaloacetate decarboxylase gamma subunit